MDAWLAKGGQVQDALVEQCRAKIMQMLAERNAAHPERLKEVLRMEHERPDGRGFKRVRTSELALCVRGFCFAVVTAGGCAAKAPEEKVADSVREKQDALRRKRDARRREREQRDRERQQQEVRGAARAALCDAGRAGRGGVRGGGVGGARAAAGADPAAPLSGPGARAHATAAGAGGRG